MSDTASRPLDPPSGARWRCPSCKHELPTGSIRCPSCGAAFKLREPAWQDRKGVYLLLFLVAFEFGLPWLWKSPHFSRCEKVVLTLLTCLWFPGILAVPFYLVHHLVVQFLSVRPG
ncbi:MAG: hypothetical protein HYZ53_17750 [Planctomycetes bacterium]|nr:hypothetical protein [Planctomycetota bacterium]